MVKSVYYINIQRWFKYSNLIEVYLNLFIYLLHRKPRTCLQKAHGAKNATIDLKTTRMTMDHK